MTPKADDTKDAAVEESDGVSDGKNEPPKGAEARDEKTKPPKPPATEDASGFRPSLHVTTTRKMETGIVVGPTASHHSRAVRSTGAEKNAPAFVVEILETVLARASETAEARAAASVTAVASASRSRRSRRSRRSCRLAVDRRDGAVAERNTEAPRKTPRADAAEALRETPPPPRPPWTCSRRRIRDARSRIRAPPGAAARCGVDRRRGASSSAAEKRRRSRAT